MKIVFIGCVDFSKLLLEAIISSNTVEIVGIVTKKKSKFNSDFCDLSEIATRNSIDYFYYESSKVQNEMLEWIQSKNPDIIFCFGWSHLISQEIIDYPKHGVLGYHPAELPKNRGRHPIIWALALGLKQTASTFFMIDGGADSGDIVSQQIVLITNNDDANTLYIKLNEVAKKQIQNICSALVLGKLERNNQNHSLSNNWRKRSEKDGRIDWRMSTRAIFNLIRALTSPYPGAYFEYKEDKVIVWKAAIGSSKILLENHEPGKILEVHEAFVRIKTGDGAIDIANYENKFKPIVGEYL